MAGPECMEAGSWSAGLMMSRYPDLIIFPLCLVRPRCRLGVGRAGAGGLINTRLDTHQTLTPAPDLHTTGHVLHDTPKSPNLQASIHNLFIALPIQIKSLTPDQIFQLSYYPGHF